MNEDLKLNEFLQASGTPEPSPSLEQRIINLALSSEQKYFNLLSGLKELLAIIAFPRPILSMALVLVLGFALGLSGEVLSNIDSNELGNFLYNEGELL